MKYTSRADDGFEDSTSCVKSLNFLGLEEAVPVNSKRAQCDTKVSTYRLLRLTLNYLKNRAIANSLVIFVLNF